MASRGRVCAGLLAGGLALLVSGCFATVMTVGPRCPEWSEEAVAELGAVLGAGKYPNLEEAIGRQELFCQAQEPADDETVCVGSRLGCWWAEVWR